MLDERHKTAINELKVNQKVWIREPGGNFLPHTVTQIFPNTDGNPLMIHLNGKVKTVLGVERIADRIEENNFRLFDPSRRRQKRAIK